MPGIGIDAYINFLIQPKLWTGIVDAFSNVNIEVWQGLEAYPRSPEG